MSSAHPVNDHPDPSKTATPDAMGTGPLAVYRAHVGQGTLAADPAQAAAARRLDLLADALDGYVAENGAARTASSGRLAFLGRLGIRRRPEARPRGVYLVGAVGRGKSMLMDMFFAEAPVALKRRIHFHRFMQDAHATLHVLKRADPTITDPIPPLADSIAREATLLCFDEFQVNDITDALILGRLFEALFARGVVVVATSNVRPERLFQDRPGADAFKPFIAVLLRELDTFELVSARDYRRRRVIEGTTWFQPADDRADAAIDDAFAALTESQTPHPATLSVMGRTVTVPLAAAGVARFEFDALCATPLGAGDYLAIARAYHTVLIDRVPRLGPDNFDLARRFIVLIDALYEAHVKLIASADAAPDLIYEKGENAFAFERTASRLAEMQSRTYRDLPHAP